MKTSLLILISFVAPFASAGVVNIGLGQNVQLNAGDVAIVSSRGGATSAITCAGQTPEPTLPPRQAFEVRQRARFADYLQEAGRNNDALLQMQCTEYSADGAVRQAIETANFQVRETCFAAGYTTCAPPIISKERYGFRVSREHGPAECIVSSRVIGTL